MNGKSDRPEADEAAEKEARELGGEHLRMFEQLSFFYAAKELQDRGIFDLRIIYQSAPIYALTMQNKNRPGDKASLDVLWNNRPYAGRTLAEAKLISMGMRDLRDYANNLLWRGGYLPEEMSYTSKVNEFKRFVESEAEAGAAQVVEPIIKPPEKAEWPTQPPPTKPGALNLEKVKEYLPYIGIGLGLFRLLF